MLVRRSMTAVTLEHLLHSLAIHLEQNGEQITGFHGNLFQLMAGSWPRTGDILCVDFVFVGQVRRGPSLRLTGHLAPAKSISNDKSHA